MYEVFEPFLQSAAWHTDDPAAEKQFFRALHAVVADPKFDPDEMAEFMRGRRGVQREDFENDAIDRLEAAAWAVKGYLEANGL